MLHSDFGFSRHPHFQNIQKRRRRYRFPLNIIERIKKTIDTTVWQTHIHLKQTMHEMTYLGPDFVDKSWSGIPGQSLSGIQLSADDEWLNQQAGHPSL